MQINTNQREERNMAKVKAGVVGYGVIGQRLADGAALQKDMKLAGVAYVSPTLAVRALKEKGASP
jgi:glyceraldehyde-3-phosphate dehydrogenase (NAD(P))